MSLLSFPKLSRTQVCEACEAKRLPCNQIREELLASPSTLTEWTDPPSTASGGGSGARGSSSVTKRIRTCILCGRAPEAHPTLRQLDPGLYAQASGVLVTDTSSSLPSSSLLPSSPGLPASLEELDRLVRHPRLYGPADPPELAELSQHPYQHMVGLASAESARAHALLEAAAAQAQPSGATASASDGFIRLPLWTKSHPIAPADAPVVAARLLARSGAIFSLRFVIKKHQSHEFEPTERAAKIKVFTPCLQTLVAGLARVVRDGPPQQDDDLVRLSRALAACDEVAARTMHDRIFLAYVRKRIGDEVATLKGVRAASKAAATAKPSS